MRRIRVSFIVATLFVSIFTPISAFAVSSNPTADCSAGSTCSITFSYTGDYYAWTVPGGITSITFDVQGAQGGTGYSTSTGGKGGRVTGTLTTTPASVLYFYVGGVGQSASAIASTNVRTNGGFNGGGTGAYDGSGYTATGGGGGGASDIRTSTSNLNSRLVVGGGGGGGGGGTTAIGGDGGGTNGSNGALQNSSYGTVGGGGTQSTGGSALTTRNATAGSFGIGGQGGVASAYGGGGGGGGWYGGGGGSSTVDHGAGYTASGGGGSGFTHATLVTGSSMTNGQRSGDGVIIITYLNAPTPTTFTTATTPPTNTSSPITYSLTFSQNVNTVANSDFANAGTATGCVLSISAASGTSFTLTVSSCGEGTVIPKVLANSVYGTVTSSNGPTSDSLTTTPITIDRTAPTISSVTAPANKTYIPSETPTFTVGFSESVTITGTPRLTLTVGSATKYANYVSMSDSKTALFRYTVASDSAEFDTDGISVSTTLDLNSGLIRDLASNALSPLTFTAPSLTSVLVAQPAAAPTIDSITATNGQLAIYFTPGAARGSTTSTYQYSTNGGSFATRVSGTTASPLIIPGLFNGTSYAVRIRATTNAGAGDSSTAVTETPTAISITGDSTLSLTYGNSASTTAYSATGGSGTYTWTLGSVLTGISISGSTVTAANTTPAGTYSQSVRANDGSQVGTKVLTITVAKASTSISISLPGSATSAAAGGTVTITATVARAGVVNFKIGGVSISGCSSATAISTSATCSWTAPGALGSVNLSADYTPSDSSNYETSTTGSVAITIVNGVTSLTLSLTGGTTTPPKGKAINIIASIDQAGKISFFVDGKRIPGCYNISASGSSKSCSWKPAVQKFVTITSTLTPTNTVYPAKTSSLVVQVVRRTTTR